MKQKFDGIKNNFYKLLRHIKKYVNVYMKKILGYLKTNLMVEIFLIINLINGILLRYFTVNNPFALKPFLGDLTILIAISGFTYFIKPKKQIIYLLIWSFIFSTTCFINCTYYSNYISFASFSMLSTATELTGYTDAVIQNILELKDFIFFIQPVILLFFHFQFKKKDYYDKVARIEKAKRRFFSAIAITLISLGLFVTQLTSTDLSRLNKQWNRSSIVMEFGIYIYQSNDLLSCIKTKMNTMFGYDEAAKTFREYYALQKKSDSNKYTNLFEGKNVLVIHAESFQGFAMNLRFNNQDLTPNMNRIANEGIYFNNFYSQESTGTSSDSEFTFASGLMPASNGTVFMNYFDRNYTTVQKLMQEKNYYTFSMHGNNSSAWNRDMMYKYLGYNKFYSKKDYDIDEVIGLGLSDKSFFRQSVDKLEKINSENEHWYGTLIMLTNHTPFSDINDYSDYSVDINQEDGTIIKYLEGTKMGNYLKSVHYADEAIGSLMSMLDEKGLLDDTIVVIYGDHDAKLKTGEFEKLYGSENIDSVLIDQSKKPEEFDDYAYELNRKVPFIIWSKDKIGSEYTGTFDKVMGMIDISPTLENMLGTYNPYALGHDIFSIDENIVVFPDGNWMTNKLYYNSSKKEYRQLIPNDSISMDYINQNSLYADNIIDISNGIIDYNLIDKVIKGDVQLGERVN